MALPIYGRFMRKVYQDSSLKYSQSTRFKFPEGINLCEKEFYGYDDTEPDADTNADESSIEGVFD